MDVKCGINSVNKKDFKVFALINWNDREDCGKSEFCRITYELQTINKNAGVEMSTISRDGKIMGNGNLEGKIRVTVLDIFNWRYLLTIKVVRKGVSKNF